MRKALITSDDREPPSLYGTETNRQFPGNSRNPQINNSCDITGQKIEQREEETIEILPEHMRQRSYPRG